MARGSVRWLLGGGSNRMLSPMHGPLQRLGPLMVALGIALVGAPAFAQAEGGWFDDTGGEVVDSAEEADAQDQAADSE